MQRLYKKKRKTKEKPYVPAIQQPDNANLVNGNIPYDILKYQVGSYLCEPRDQAAFIQTCRLAHSLFQLPLNEIAYKILAQAVIDDDRETIKKLLDHIPSLVLFAPSKGIVIESQKTWQRFYLVENVLTIAAKRKQIEMLKFLFQSCDQIKSMNDVDVKSAIEQSLFAWAFYEMQTNEQGVEEIIIPKEYTEYAEYLINVFKEENFPNENLSENTESALAFLFNLLLPKNAMKLDDGYFIDPELFLLSMYKAYRDNFATFNHNWGQLNAFCIRVIGFIHSVLAPETGKIFCEGLDDGATGKERGGSPEKISKCAQEYKLQSGESFYRSARDSHDGSGSTYFAGLRWGFACKLGLAPYLRRSDLFL